MMDGIWMGGGWLFGLIVAGGVVLLIVLVVRIVGGGVQSAGRREQDAPTPSSARQLLDERYARGELTTEEYQKRVRVLGDAS
jgi:putative membrane protein